MSIDHGRPTAPDPSPLGDQGYLIDPARFFVRNHTSTPTIDAATWRLRVAGDSVRRPLELSYRQLCSSSRGERGWRPENALCCAAGPGPAPRRYGASR